MGQDTDNDTEGIEPSDMEKSNKNEQEQNEAVQEKEDNALKINEEYKKKHWTSQRLTTLDIFSTDTETKQVVSAQNEELNSPDLVLDKTNNDGMDNEKMEETNILIS